MSKKSPTYELYLKDLIQNVYCRLQPSTIHGVGVFAIRTIPKGTNVFASFLPVQQRPESISIPKDKIFNNPRIPEPVKQIIRDFMTVHEGYVDFPSFGLNELNITYYLNHSNTPNVETHDGETFFAMRDIKSGEELYSHYGTYTEEDLGYLKAK